MAEVSNLKVVDGGARLRECPVRLPRHLYGKHPVKSAMDNVDGQSRVRSASAIWASRGWKAADTGARCALRAYDACQAGDEQDARALFERLDRMRF